MFLAWYQAKFVNQLQAGLSQRLFSLYLYQPWAFHLQRNSAPLIRNIVNEVALFANVVTALTTLATESLVILGIGLLLLVLEPAGAVGVVVLLGLATWVFQLLMQKRLVAWGTNRRHHDRLRLQHVHQGLAGAKDAKLLGREASFIEAVNRHTVVMAAIGARISAAQHLPRLWYEFLAVAGLTVLAGTLVWQGNTGSGLVARLGLFAVAAFRLLPSANRLLLNWQTARFTQAVVDGLHEELTIQLNQPPTAHRHRLPFSDEISVNDVWLKYDGASEPSLRGVSFSIPHGQSLGIVGGSGAGKSTLVDVILGLLTPDRGTVAVDGKDVHSSLRDWQNNIGYVPQSIYLTDDTIRGNVAFGVPADEIDDAAVRQALEAAQLGEFVDYLPARAETIVGERGVRLSGGQRQRIGIARALYLDPEVLVLDEATSSLDTETELGVMNAVNRLHGRKTLIIVAHRLSTVAACDELIKLEKGRIVSTGKFADVTGSPAS